MNKSTMDN